MPGGEGSPAFGGGNEDAAGGRVLELSDCEAGVEVAGRAAGPMSGGGNSRVCRWWRWRRERRLLAPQGQTPLCTSWARLQLRRRLPCLVWLPRYSRTLFFIDVSTGITVGVVLIPQAIAYALLAELPPTYGLYSSLLPLAVFAPLTSSRHVALGPFALISMLVADSVSEVVDPTRTDEYCQAAVLLSAMVGVVHLLMAAVRADFIVSLLSDPVLAGFTSAASLLIGLSQLKHVVGFDVPRGSAVDMIRHTVAHVGELNPWALGVGAASFVSLKALKTLNRKAFPWLRLPEQLVVVVASAVFAYATATDGAPLLPTVGRVPAGLPSPRWPVRGDSALVLALVRPALLVAFFSYVVTISVAKPFSLKNGYKIDPNQELVALGLCNVVGSFWSAYPASASLSRSALVASLTGPSGTPMHGLWQAGVVLLVLTLLTPAFEWLPYAALAAIVLCAVASLFDPCRVRAIWSVSRPDAGLWALAFVSTLALGVQLGIAVSVGGSMLVIVLHSMRPHHAVLGRVPGTAVYRSRRLYPEARSPNRSLIFRWDASIHFANADHFRDSLMAHIRSYATARTPTGRATAAPFPPSAEAPSLSRASETGAPLHVVILEFGGVNNVDTTALRMLCDLAREMDQRGITLIVSSCKSQVRHRLKKSGFLAMLGEANHFARLSEAAKYAELLVQAFEGEQPGAQSDAGEPVPVGDPRRKRSSWSKLSMRMERHILETGDRR